VFRGIFSPKKKEGSDGSDIDITTVAGARSLFKMAPEVEIGLMVRVRFIFQIENTLTRASLQPSTPLLPSRLQKPRKYYSNKSVFTVYNLPSISK